MSRHDATIDMDRLKSVERIDRVGSAAGGRSPGWPRPAIGSPPRRMTTLGNLHRLIQTDHSHNYPLAEESAAGRPPRRGSESAERNQKKKQQQQKKTFQARGNQLGATRFIDNRR